MNAVERDWAASDSENFMMASSDGDCMFFQLNNMNEGGRGKSAMAAVFV